ncbi:MAG: DUF6520 family protein [Candidatus Pseudobacter hemicellulosilyticus]|uniref:DUF6520 family protein n=1 Tax=Candidatus Pseudobacter hemicellulosilyticus TaxID=3121375 RepID=A0AAJ6BFK8_9BACT|nr:MAG: DUF6520 family protein [Pseudobacter sp.]
MKKLKATLLTVAIVTAVAGAAASAPCWNCENSVQWVPNGTGGWKTAGTYGVTYYCNTGPQSTCTWIENNGEMQSCRLGVYTSLIGRRSGIAPEK